MKKKQLTAESKEYLRVEHNVHVYINTDNEVMINTGDDEDDEFGWRPIPEEWLEDENLEWE